MGKYSPYAIAEDKVPDWKPGEELAAAAFVGISIFIILDVNVGILRVFRKAQGMYYWSMKLGTIACLVDVVGVILKYLVPNPYHVWWLYTFCLLIGWSIYAPAQLLVLYSRLHLVNDSRKLQRWVFITIISTYLFLIIPTWVVAWPAYDSDPKISSLWSPRMAIVERYTQIGFTLVEMVISAIYIWSLFGLLNLKSSVRQRRVMLDLVYVNLIIVSLDIVVVILLYLNQTGSAHPVQTCSYAVKFKLEFVVLNQLMAVAARGVQRSNFEERRYHHASDADAFSAECNEWDKRLPERSPKDIKGGQSDSQELSQPESLQIEIPPPVQAQKDRRSKDISHKKEPNNSRRISSQNYDEKQRNQNPFGTDPGTFLDVDDNDTDALPHKPSEAFSGSTLQLPSRRSPSPPHLPKQSMPEPRPHRNGRNHDRQSQEPWKAPHIARMRRRIPKNARYVNYSDRDEEEEIGVHMWENRKGSLVMEVPWFEPRVAE